MFKNPASIAALARNDLQGAIDAATPGMAEPREAEGQAAMLASGMLPITDQQRGLFDAMGFTLGARVDQLFVEARLPPGWSMRPTDLSMWSEIFDHHGRKRVHVFYKAAIVGPDGQCQLATRFKVVREYSADHKPTAATVMDGDTVLHRVPFPPPPEEFSFDHQKKLTDLTWECHVWLDANHPGWWSPAAYWDDAPAAAPETPKP